MRAMSFAAITAVLTITLPVTASCAEKYKHGKQLQPVIQVNEVSSFLSINENFILPLHLPTKFLGHNPREIILIAIDKLPALKKNQFETTEEYVTRTFEPDNLIAPLSTRKVYAFTDELHSRYIADEGVITSSIGIGSKSDVPNADITLSYSNEVTGSYVAKNAYGAVLDVSKNTGTRFEISFNKVESSKFFGKNLNEKFDNGPYNTNISCFMDIPMTAVEAKQEIDHLAILYITNLKPNLLSSETNLFQPEIRDPVERKNTSYKLQVKISEIYVYSRESGKIIASLNGDQNSVKLKCN